MTEAANAPMPETVRHASTLRIVVLTLTGVVVSVGLVGGLVTGWVLYRRDAHQVSRLRAQVVSLQTANTDAYRRGMNAQLDQNKAFHLTYGDGYKAGIASVFSGFKEPWVDGGWYVVRIGHASGGHTITQRADMTICEPFYVDRSNNVYGLSTTEC